jgi:ligand-binding SRPBCC domain-containing protein
VIELRFESLVAASPEKVWSRVSTMPGVNAELMPILRMTYPPALSNLDAAPRELLGKLAFKSWVLLLGLLPIDRHFLSLASVTTGEGFDERSSSWSNRIWNHRRTLTPVAGGTYIVDELAFEPRVKLAAPFLRWFVGTVFNHRHRVLCREFGSVD